MADRQQFIDDALVLLNDALVLLDAALAHQPAALVDLAINILAGWTPDNHDLGDLQTLRH